MSTDAPEPAGDEFLVVEFVVPPVSPHALLAVGGGFEEEGAYDKSQCGEVAEPEGWVECWRKYVAEIDRETNEGGPSGLYMRDLVDLAHIQRHKNQPNTLHYPVNGERFRSSFDFVESGIAFSFDRTLSFVVVSMRYPGVVITLTAVRKVPSLKLQIPSTAVMSSCRGANVDSAGSTAPGIPL